MSVRVFASSVVRVAHENTSWLGRQYHMVRSRRLWWKSFPNRLAVSPLVNGVEKFAFWRHFCEINPDSRLPSASSTAVHIEGVRVGVAHCAGHLTLKKRQIHCAWNVFDVFSFFSWYCSMTWKNEMKNLMSIFNPYKRAQYKCGSLLLSVHDGICYGPMWLCKLKFELGFWLFDRVKSIYNVSFDPIYYQGHRT